MRKQSIPGRFSPPTRPGYEAKLLLAVVLKTSFTDRRNGCTKFFSYHAHGTADGDKFCCYPWLVCHDIKGTLFKKISVIMTLSLGPLPPPLRVMAKVADSGNGTAGTAMAVPVFEGEKMASLGY